MEQDHQILKIDICKNIFIHIFKYSIVQGLGAYPWKSRVYYGKIVNSLKKKGDKFWIVLNV
jgi:hypothetical protein